MTLTQTNRNDWFNMLNENCVSWVRKGSDEIVMWFAGDISDAVYAAKENVEELGGSAFLIRYDVEKGQTFMLISEPVLDESVPATVSNAPAACIKLYQDGQNGSFLAVKKSMLDKFNIAHKLMGSVFVKGKTAYLDANLDLELFLKSFQEHYGYVPRFMTKRSERAQIRSYNKLTLLS